VSRRVFDPASDAYRELTSRPLLVIDTETTDAGKDQPHRVVSYAYVLIENGELSRKNAYHSLVNPGIPISKRTNEVHGISDTDVASKRGFAFHVPRLTRMLSTPDVVLVAHNVNFDVSVLRAEFDRAGHTVPDVPVIDTMYLPRTLGYQPDTLGTRPALALLASTLGVTNTRPHSADADTDTTAKVLLRLLREAAATGQLVSIEDLLTAHDRGTTADVTGNVHIRRNGSSGPAIPDAHLARRVQHRHRPPVPARDMRMHPRHHTGVHGHVDELARHQRVRAHHHRTRQHLHLHVTHLGLLGSPPAYRPGRSRCPVSRRHQAKCSPRVQCRNRSRLCGGGQDR
jgi:DNA polymerase III epsilon subunit-like protein